jgi:hypothetical protein
VRPSPAMVAAVHALQTLFLPGAYTMQPHVVYSAYLRRYVMTFAAGYYLEMALTAPLAQSGLYVAFSEDGADWSVPKQLVVDYVDFLPGKSFSWEVSIVWDDDGGQQGWLVYAHRDAGEGSFYMVGHRIAFH